MSTTAGRPDQPGGARPSGVQRASPSPHDALFRRIFGEPVHAASQLRAILPPALAARLTTAPGNTHLAKNLVHWSTELRATIDHFGIETFLALLTYIHSVGETPPEDLDRLMEQLGPDAQEANMTTADMLRAEGEARGRAEGEARGRAEGEARGRAEGEARGRAEALVQLITLKFGTPSDAVPAGIHTAAAAQIEAWTARVLTATSIDDVLS